MPVWIWVILVVFFITMTVAGLVYAIRHALSAWHTVAETGGRIGDLLSRLESTQTERQAERPSFTQPLSMTAERYADAHAEVIRNQERRRDRHVLVWKRWKSFND
ncbi:hypothetical protein KIH77_05340 [Bifidobacterium sp. 82T24]|uniref:hypothetical protein n=1 Tax=Bifidobacterium pluvialisilvae TaxID=2834436 RepID=UPI001C592256|nr:hypothetical protein [Bifidobacterium pluvialisilvae]MBW3088153.1 hypothetical protein [Bifidobacterium pluvialisilvae]